jgi:hypothetical protein
MHYDDNNLYICLFKFLLVEHLIDFENFWLDSTYYYKLFNNNEEGIWLMSEFGNFCKLQWLVELFCMSNGAWALKI